MVGKSGHACFPGLGALERLPDVDELASMGHKRLGHFDLGRTAVVRSHRIIDA